MPPIHQPLDPRPSRHRLDLVAEPQPREPIVEPAFATLATATAAAGAGDGATGGRGDNRRRPPRPPMKHRAKRLIAAMRVPLAIGAGGAVIGDRAI